MSDVSQGLGWWLASDGKWYSPEQAPGPVPTNPIPDGRPLGGSAVPPTIPVSVPGTPSTPPGSASPPTSGYGLPPGAPGYGPPPSPAGYGYPTGYGYLPVQKTNGLAVASLVCSLLWVFGLGAVLAVVFGSIPSPRSSDRTICSAGADWPSPASSWVCSDCSRWHCSSWWWSPSTITAIKQAARSIPRPAPSPDQGAGRSSGGPARSAVLRPPRCRSTRRTRW